VKEENPKQSSEIMSHKTYAIAARFQIRYVYPISLDCHQLCMANGCGCMHAKTILVTRDNYSDWPGESNRSNSKLTDVRFLLCPYPRQNANTTLSLQLPMEFGNIVWVETSRYLTKITTLRRKADREFRSMVLATKHTAPLQLLCTVGGNQARLDARTQSCACTSSGFPPQCASVRATLHT
jgi:hypothetical protein